MYNLVVDMASCSAQHVRDPVVKLMRPTSPKQYAACSNVPVLCQFVRVHYDCDVIHILVLWTTTRAKYKREV